MASKRMHLDVYDVEAHPNSKGFTLTFRGDTSQGNPREVVLSFDAHWWITVLADVLWSVARFKRRELHRIEDALKGER